MIASGARAQNDKGVRSVPDGLSGAGAIEIDIVLASARALRMRLRCFCIVLVDLAVIAFFGDFAMRALFNFVFFFIWDL